MSEEATDPSLRSAPLWTLALLVASGAVTLLCYVLPTRGLTFLWDDWVFLENALTTPAPRRWFLPHMNHVLPSFVAWFDTMHVVFGARAWGFILVACAVHLLNVYLMARLLRQRTGDERLAAVATAFFGLSTVYREVLWWASAGGIVFATTCALLGLICLERGRSGGTRPFLACGLLAFVAPTLHGVGFFLGPILALEAAFIVPGERRLRALGAILLPWCLYLALYLSIGGGGGARLPRNLGQLHTFLIGCAYALGLGLVKPALAMTVADTVGSATALALVYVMAVLGVLPFLENRRRIQVLGAQLLLGAELGSVVLTRWYWWSPVALAASRYQYFPAIAWTMLAAAVLGATGKYRDRALGAAVLVVAVLAILQVQGASRETRLCAPPFRGMQSEFVKHLTSVAAASKGALYDADLPVTFPNHASTLVRIISPEISVIWTSTRSEATIAPYLADDLLGFLPSQAPLGEHGPLAPR